MQIEEAFDLADYARKNDLVVVVSPGVSYSAVVPEWEDFFCPVYNIARAYRLKKRLKAGLMRGKKLSEITFNGLLELDFYEVFFLAGADEMPAVQYLRAHKTKSF
ncbi:hypothetical protein JXB11_01440 [Candidatus Woesearchaeota archaeon]|nr:hypothetical protein [Candidatus Woesearchaeota archaeon]